LKAAYVDTSCLVATSFGEAGAKAVAAQLASFDILVASNLLEAELQSVFVRQRADMPEDLLSPISWVIPDRPLRPEIRRVLSVGHVRGADCWHLATALYVTADPGELSFLTLDLRQRDVAERLGFLV
jgi:hypothetical protein